MNARLTLLLAFVFLVSCSVMEFATPEQRARQLELQEQTDAAQAALEAKNAELALLDEAVKAQIAKLEEVETAAQLAVVQEGITNAVALYTEKRAEHVAAMTAFEAAAAAEGEHRQEIMQAAGQGFAGIGTQIGGPAVGAGVLAVTSLLARFATDRGREHLKATLSNAAKLQLRDAAAAALRATGFLHTTDDPDALIDAAASVAAKKGDLEKAQRITDAKEAIAA